MWWVIRFCIEMIGVRWELAFGAEWKSSVAAGAAAILCHFCADEFRHCLSVLWISEQICWIFVPAKIELWLIVILCKLWCEWSSVVICESSDSGEELEIFPNDSEESDATDSEGCRRDRRYRSESHFGSQTAMDASLRLKPWELLPVNFHHQVLVNR